MLLGRRGGRWRGFKGRVGRLFEGDVGGGLRGSPWKGRVVAGRGKGVSP